MSVSLTRGILESHLDPGATRMRAAVRATEAPLPLQHALLDADSATLVFQLFERSGRSKVAGETTLVCAESLDVSAAFEDIEELRYVQSAARHYGAHFSRPGNGRAHHVYAARFAAPGRVLLACAEGATAVGALGTLVFTASELEMAGALAAQPYTAPLRPVWAVRVEGRLPSWVDGHDLALAVARRLPAFGPIAPCFEYRGSGVASLPQRDRVTAAREGAALGMVSSLFPSDEVTREWLRTQGREPDWKPLHCEPDAEAERVFEVHLDTLEPMVVRPEPGSEPLEAREVSGLPVSRVVLGPDLGLADVLLCADMLRGRGIAPGMELVLIPGSHEIRHAAAARGALAVLREAGARIVDAERRLAPGARHGTVLLCGGSTRAAGRATSVLRVGPAVAVASALAGRVADPRELPAPASVTGPAERVPPPDVLMVKPASDPSTTVVMRGSTIRRLPTMPPMITTLRGTVLIRLPDRVSTEMLLPNGPRVWRDRGNLAKMAAHVLAGIDPSFPGRARTLGGGFVAAGTDFGIGPHRPHALLALVQLGVRAVIAISYDPAHRAEMVRYGILPLRSLADADPSALRPGDELEIPGMPDGLERNKPVVLRNLTRGTQISLLHDLSEREIEVVRTGGLLSTGLAAGAAR